jgi:hypothetical protein
MYFQGWNRAKNEASRDTIIARKKEAYKRKQIKLHKILLLFKTKIFSEGVRFCPYERQMHVSPLFFPLSHFSWPHLEHCPHLIYYSLLLSLEKPVVGRIFIVTAVGRHMWRFIIGRTLQCALRLLSASTERFILNVFSSFQLIHWRRLLLSSVLVSSSTAVPFLQTTVNSEL